MLLVCRLGEFAPPLQELIVIGKGELFKFLVLLRRLWPHLDVEAPARDGAWQFRRAFDPKHLRADLRKERVAVVREGSGGVAK